MSEILGNKKINSQFLGNKPIIRTYKGDELLNEYKPLYNPPSDWKDIRSDCPENSIALYAAHSRINNPNYNIEKVTGPVKYTVVGNPTINNDIVSGFSSSDYLNILNSIPVNNFSGNIKFKINSSATFYGSIFFLNFDGSKKFTIESDGTHNFRIYHWNTSTSNNKVEAIYEVTQGNTWYNLGFNYDNTLKTIQISITDINTQEVITTKTYQNFDYTGNGTIQLGYYWNNFDGSIDLNNTYIKVNNQMWFGSQIQLTSANPNIYLQSSGTQYIDTGIIGNGNTGLETKYNITDNQMLFGSRYSFANRALNFFKEVNGRFDYNNKSYIITNTGSWGLHREGIFLSYPTGNNYYFQTKNNDETIYATTELAEFTTPGNLFLFACNNNGTAGLFSTSKIYYFKIYNNSILVRHFVPVPSGLVIGDFTCPSDGMFDIVEQKFYGNAGTGDFTYGNDSPETITYDNLGFTATCTGGYKVFIDGNQYGGVRTSGSQCNIIWSQSGITTGDNITTPSAMKAHKIWISPAAEGNNIIRFKCSRVAASGNEAQGVLWGHFNISNIIIIESAFTDANSSQHKNTLLTAVTAKNNVININTASASALATTFADSGELVYLPVINGNDGNYDLYRTFRNCIKLTKINFKNVGASTAASLVQVFLNCRALKKLPEINLTNTTNMSDYVTNAVALENTVLDASTATGLTKIGCYGTSQYFMGGFKGLRVSNQAPFNHTTAPQINVSYTGMDRQALVTLFNDLPTVTNGQIINITGCTGTGDLTVDDVLIAENKGWTVTK